ncbi:diphthine--ammonia ligase [Pedobacter sp. AW1-32]|uniref:Dph6-related ATP pyrophosphatase n=1 Tax=Pedobacter sp. AW1-32 TaxID=3383026 RepID=UPI003FF0D36B
MRSKKICVFNWSGGKDSTLALHYALQDPEIKIRYLLTTISAQYNRISMHGVRYELLVKQAESIGIPLYEIHLPEMPDMETYNEIMRDHLFMLKAEGITHSIFGDIFLEDLKKYREEKLAEVGLQAIFPLWQKDTKSIIQAFLSLGYKTIIVCAQEELHFFCGKVLDEKLIDNFPKHIDVCGEKGEFHTFAFEGPIFHQSINFTIGEQVHRVYEMPKKEDNKVEEKYSYGFWYTDLLP